MARYLENLSQRNRKKDDTSGDKSMTWFLILLLTGIGICLPKLLRPTRVDKQGYLEAANWLRENTAPTAVIAVPDRRIAFYAERKQKLYGKKISIHAKYIVEVITDGVGEANINVPVRQEYSGWVARQKKKKRFVIYKVL